MCEPFVLDLVVMSLRVGKISEDGGDFGRSLFSFGKRSARMRVRISSQGRKSQLKAAHNPRIQLPVINISPDRTR